MSKGLQFTERYLKMMFSSLRDATPEAVREELERCRSINNKTVRVPRYFREQFSETAFVASNGFKMQVFSTKPYPEQHTLILYLHGGASIYQPVFFHWRFVHDIAIRTHCQVLMPLYPKYPEYHCVDDIEVMLDFYSRYVMPLHYQRIVLMGDSFGGGLALSMCQEFRHRGLQPITDLVALSPCVDNAFSRRDQMVALQPYDTMLQLERIETIMGGWRGDLPATHPWASPVYGDLSAFPNNTIVIYGSHEILKADAELLVEKMKSAGQPVKSMEYEGMFHTFPLFPIKEGFHAIREIATSLRNNASTS